MGEPIGYARCSRNERYRTPQREIPLTLDVPEDRIRLDHGPAGTNRDIGGSLTARGVKLSLSGDVHGPADPMDKMYRNTPAAIAEFEVDLLRMHTRDGMAVAWAKGRLKGQRAELTARQRTHLVRQHQPGEHTTAGLAGLFSISRATVHRVLERHRKAPEPATSGGQ